MSHRPNTDMVNEAVQRRPAARVRSAVFGYHGYRSVAWRRLSTEASRPRTSP